MYSRLTLFTFFFFLVIGCGQSEKEKNQALKDQVIAIHDEVMPKMGELKALKREIDEKATNLRAELSESELEDLSRISNDLDQAFEGMFVWMRQFKTDYTDMTEDEIKEYLLDQKVKVEKVNVDIKTSLSDAKEALGKD